MNIGFVCSRCLTAVISVSTTCTFSYRLLPHTSARLILTYSFADNGLSDVESFLYFPADGNQMIAIIKKVFFDHGLRFVFSTRAKVPYILKENSQDKFYGEDYEFVPGQDEVIREGKDGYVITFGDMLYRCVDAVDRINATSSASFQPVVDIPVAD